VSDKRDANDVAREHGPHGLAEELTRRTDEAEAIPPTQNASNDATPADPPRFFSNCHVVIQTDGKGEPITMKNGKPKTRRDALTVDEMSTNLFAMTGNWPKAVGKTNPLLFVEHNGTVRILPTVDSLFAWIQERTGKISWQGGQDNDVKTITPKKEFFEHVRERAERFEAVSEVPHEPPLEGHYYTWKPPKGYDARGEYLARLLALFDNGETPEDMAMIKAMFLTPAWGAVNGTRPAFAITAPDKGCGKSTLGEMAGELYGGNIVHTLTRNDDEKLSSRLLSAEALTKRVVLVDNAKQSIASANLEQTITLGTISGHLLYHGDSSRPNTLTVILTANGLRLSRDMARRCYIIRLKRPAVCDDRKEQAKALIKNYRDYILADIVEELRKPVAPSNHNDPGGWKSFVNQVMTRCTNTPEKVVSLTQARRDERDDDLADAEEIMEAIDAEVSQNSTADTRVFISSTRMTEVINGALNKNLTKKSVCNLLSDHMEAGRLARVEKTRTASAKGYHIQRPPKPEANTENQSHD